MGPAEVGTPGAALEAALRADPARPLVTFHDHATGERAELSVATFANWVAKTANLLRDELDAQPGAVVALRIPLHWQALVLAQAAWAVGGVVDLAGDGTAPVDVAVVAHDQAEAPADADEVVSLGLGPLGLPQPGRTPAYPRALDFDRAVRSHGDRFVPVAAADPRAPAMRAGAAQLTGADLVRAASAAAPALPAGGRLLVTEALTEPAALVGALLVPLLAGTGVVLVRHADAARLPSTVAQEGVVAVLRRELPSGATPGDGPAAFWPDLQAMA